MPRIPRLIQLSPEVAVTARATACAGCPTATLPLRPPRPRRF